MDLQLKDIDSKCAQSFSEKSGTILEEFNNIFFREFDSEKDFGVSEELLRNNHRNHITFMVSIVDNFSESVFKKTCEWAVRTYIQHGVKPYYWQVALPLWKKVITDIAGRKHIEQIITLYDAMEEIVKQETSVQGSGDDELKD